MSKYGNFAYGTQLYGSGAVDPVVTVNVEVTVPFFGRHVYTTADLSATDDVSAFADLTFNISETSDGGYIWYADGSTFGVNPASFTGADLVAGYIQFVSDGTGNMFQWTFTVEDEAANSSAPTVASVNITSAAESFPPRSVRISELNRPWAFRSERRTRGMRR